LDRSSLDPDARRSLPAGSQPPYRSSHADSLTMTQRIYGAYSSSSGVCDVIRSVAVAYAILSGHRKITRSEYRILDMLEPHLRNPNEAVKLQILACASRQINTRHMQYTERELRDISPICLKSKR
jgi:hypothetical protein